MNTTITTNSSVMDLVIHAGWVARLVLLLLAGASVFCWAIILSKAKLMKSALKENHHFFEIFWNSKNLDEIFTRVENFDQSPAAAVFKNGFKELKKLNMSDRSDFGQPEVENIQRSLARAAQEEVATLEKNLGWLATTASAAPFVGLLGTVWGIMDSFRNIGATGAANLAVVAPGISEALIATAAGLLAAIPAVVAYNFFLNKIKKIAIDMDGFSQDFLNIVQRSFLVGRKKS
ncbi:MAG: protein TolQ [Xanthomonadaceae bacterium]|nr:protein TolQ [Xanthomonadaceae bacterium]